MDKDLRAKPFKPEGFRKAVAALAKTLKRPAPDDEDLPELPDLPAQGEDTVAEFRGK